MNYVVYILYSKPYNRYYIGCTSNLDRRLSDHNDGKTKSTKAYVPWEIIYTESYADKTEAFLREREIKSYKSGFKFKQLINQERWQSG